MGIWSRPLFTRCTGDDGEAVPAESVNVTFTRDDFVKMDFLHYNKTDVSVGTRTFDQVIMATCDTARIWGYFDKEELMCWDALFLLTLHQNPRVRNIEAHFYCADHEHPFVIIMNRGERRGSDAHEVVHVEHGSTGHCLYSEIHYSSAEFGGDQCVFVPEMYMKAREEHENLFWDCMEEYCDIICLYQTGQPYKR